jgi:hypothetical protein
MPWIVRRGASERKSQFAGYAKIKMVKNGYWPHYGLVSYTPANHVQRPFQWQCLWNLSDEDATEIFSEARAQIQIEKHIFGMRKTRLLKEQGFQAFLIPL